MFFFQYLEENRISLETLGFFRFCLSVHLFAIYHFVFINIIFALLGISEEYLSFLNHFSCKYCAHTHIKLSFIFIFLIFQLICNRC